MHRVTLSSRIILFFCIRYMQHWNKIRNRDKDTRIAQTYIGSIVPSEVQGWFGRILKGNILNKQTYTKSYA